MPNSVCPLCKQPVSEQLYEKITGIWRERRAQEKQLREQQKQILAEQREWRKKRAEERKTLKVQQKEIIARNIASKTKRFEITIARIARQKQRIQERAERDILRATKAAERAARAHANEELKKKVDESLNKAVAKATSKSTKDLFRATQTLESTRKQMTTLQQNSLKQQERIKNLETQLKKQTTPQLEGLLYEDQLLEALKKEFPSDKFTHTGKGGDILQEVMSEDNSCGLMVYECKRVSHWQSAHAEQAFQARVQRKADYAILVSNASKKGTAGFFVEKGVIVIHPAGALEIAGILRDHVIQMSKLKLTHAEKEEAIEKILHYLQGADFKNSVEVIIRSTIDMDNDLRKEIQDHVKGWKRTRSSLVVIHKSAIRLQTKTAALISGKAGDFKEDVVEPPFPALPELGGQGGHGA